MSSYFEQQPNAKENEIIASVNLGCGFSPD